MRNPAFRQHLESLITNTVFPVVPAAGTIKGDVRVSGHPKVQATFARIMGYVEQYDIHSPNVRPCTGAADQPTSPAHLIQKYL